ncbi:MAG: Smr/MutS family protein [Bacteroidetes bacterium]|nr:Smr/MutS family protein [Bacteroidota bacterium]MCH8524061.1 Smr/MutS family protein [Balneolales bacterium]
MIRELSLKYRVHTDLQAVDAVKLAIHNANLSGQAVVKVVHGYGSEGLGGSNKNAVHTLLTELASQKIIKTFYPGEKFIPAAISALSKRFNGHKQAFDKLRRDCGNEGITIVLLK